MCCDVAVQSWWEIVQAYAKGDNKSPLLRLRGPALTTLVQAMVHYPLTSCSTPYRSNEYLFSPLFLWMCVPSATPALSRPPKPTLSAQWRTARLWRRSTHV
jgi:hypothetical protein